MVNEATDIIQCRPELQVVLVCCCCAMWPGHAASSSLQMPALSIKVLQELFSLDIAKLNVALQ